MQSQPHLFLNAHHQGSLPQQLEVVWSPLLQADSKGPTLIFNEAPRTSPNYGGGRARGTL
jgi:hypothetical protein